GNITGLTNMSADLAGKRLELLKEALPGVERVAVMWNPDYAGAPLEWAATETAARNLRVSLVALEGRGPAPPERALRVALSVHADALFGLAEPSYAAYDQRIAERTLESRLPIIRPTYSGDLSYKGILMAYGPDIPNLYQRAAENAARILNGTKPSDLPI